MRRREPVFGQVPRLLTLGFPELTVNFLGSGGIMGRTVAICMNCREERAIVAHGLCANCYMQQRREEDDNNPWAAPEKHAAEQRKRQAEGRKALVSMLDKLDILEKSGLMPEEEVGWIRGKVATQLERAVLALKSEPLGMELAGIPAVEPEEEDQS